MFQRSARLWVLPAVLLPLLAAGCGGTGDTNNGSFGGTNGGTLGGTPSSGAAVPNATPGAASGGLQPNAAPLAPQVSPPGTTPATGNAQVVPVTNGPLAPLSGTYAGTWAAVTAPARAPSGQTPAITGDAPSKSTAAVGGAVALKIAYPAHPSKTVLGDVSGTWADPTLGGVGKISGTIDRVGLPSEPNAVHVVGKVQFPGGKSQPLTVELSEDAVGHLAGGTDAGTISLKKSR